MFKVKTVFVVGAGASYEVGLPTGEGLKFQIRHKLNMLSENNSSNALVSGDPAIREILKREAKKLDAPATKFFAAAQQVSNAMDLSVSIDNYLHAHNDSPEKILCGKLAIAQTILEAERGSRLSGMSPSKCITMCPGPKVGDGEREHWLVPFFKLLSVDVARDDVTTIFDNVSFVSFNYDRCIEHFLYNALQNYYNIPDAKVQEVMKKLVILHPYGQIGYLPWQEEKGGTPFGEDPKNTGLLEKADQIQTFTETSERHNIEDIRAEIQSAHALVFLGFGYHDLNMNLLCSTERQGYAKWVLGTAFGMSKNNMNIITEVVKKKFCSHNNQVPTAIIDPNVTCNKLFYEYWNSFLSST